MVLSYLKLICFCIWALTLATFFKKEKFKSPREFWVMACKWRRSRCSVFAPGWHKVLGPSHMARTVLGRMHPPLVGCCQSLLARTCCPYHVPLHRACQLALFSFSSIFSIPGLRDILILPILDSKHLLSMQMCLRQRCFTSRKPRKVTWFPWWFSTLCCF